MPTPQEVLKHFWQYDHFRSGQLKIIEAALNGRDVLALLPTGGGKSICYQVPAVLLPGLTIVISPLISLMQDQVQNLLSRGIPATYLASSVDKQEMSSRMIKLRNGEYTLVYLSPERLKQDAIQAVFKTLTISLIVIDEAHCISQWGHSFRPPYRAIAARVKLIRPDTPIMALTATATPQTALDLIATLRLQDPYTEKLSFFRDIAIHVWRANHVMHKDLQLLLLLKQLGNQPTIIYASTRENVELVAHWLNSLKTFLKLSSVGKYHAGMGADDREAEQRAFLENTTKIMVATSAFGMGIDKPDITTVIHYQLPGSIEQFYQEIGRAGRGGQHSQSHLLLAPNDLTIQQAMATTHDSKQTTRNSHKLRSLINFTTQNCCRMQGLCAYFGEQLETRCSFCDRCDPSFHFYNQDTDHLSQQLSHWRTILAKHHNYHPASILNDAQLQLISLLKPTSVQEFKSISLFGKLWIDRWGKRLLSQSWYNTQH
ncbi:MAG: RecQ family ATP-dependent DNA helicase [Patescibacteria group bacterium]